MLSGLGPKKIKIVDFDIIEKSNLGRQFLYKEEDVGALKTQITCVNDLLPLLDNVDIVICVIDEPQYDIQRIVNKAVVT